MKSQDIAIADRAPNVRRVIEGGERNRDLRPILQPRRIDRVIELIQIGKGRESRAALLSLFRRALREMLYSLLRRWGPVLLR